eukprot:CFRG2841T1
MLIVSYNVASWTTTLREIQSHFGSLSTWLDRLNIDILCLQEVKITRDKLSQSPDLYCASIDGWDSFWGCCRTSKKGAQGFNGVATYVRKGLTVRANGEVFNKHHLDAQGRCIVTEHGDFVLFNVYAPTCGHDTKREFHNTLTCKMREMRQNGKHVILAGDLNVTRRKEDIPFYNRVISLSLLLDVVIGKLYTQKHSRTCAPDWTYSLASKIFAALPKAIELLKGLKVVMVPGSKVSKAYTRKNDSYKIESECGKKWLGRRYECDIRAASSFCVGEWADVAIPQRSAIQTAILAPLEFTNSHSPARQTPKCSLTDVQTSSTHAPSAVCNSLISHTPETRSCDDECRHVLTIKQWSACLEKGGGLVLTEREQYALSEFGASHSSSANQKWLNDLIEVDGMVDSFTAFHPHARERFTGWDQYSNRRYENEGARLDFIMVDKTLFNSLAKKGHALQGENINESHKNIQVYTHTKLVNDEEEDDNSRACAYSDAQTSGSGTGSDKVSEKLGYESSKDEWVVPGAASALYGATAGGLFAPAPFDGSGIVDAPQRAYEFHIVAAHTGMIYTPPKFSDHIAVSLLLEYGTVGVGNNVGGNVGECHAISGAMNVREANGVDADRVVVHTPHLPFQLSLDRTHAPTRRAQPFTTQKKLTSFFVSTNSSNKVFSNNVSTSSNMQNANSANTSFSACAIGKIEITTTGNEQSETISACSPVGDADQQRDVHAASRSFPQQVSSKKPYSMLQCTSDKPTLISSINAEDTAKSITECTAHSRALELVPRHTSICEHTSILAPSFGVENISWQERTLQRIQEVQFKRKVDATKSKITNTKRAKKEPKVKIGD